MQILKGVRPDIIGMVVGRDDHGVDTVYSTSYTFLIAQLDLSHIHYTILYKTNDFVTVLSQHDAGPTYEGGSHLGVVYTHKSFSIGP